MDRYREKGVCWTFTTAVRWSNADHDRLLSRCKFLLCVDIMSPRGVQQIHGYVVFLEGVTLFKAIQILPLESCIYKAQGSHQDNIKYCIDGISM